MQQELSAISNTIKNEAYENEDFKKGSDDINCDAMHRIVGICSWTMEWRRQDHSGDGICQRIDSYSHPFIFSLDCDI